MNEETEQTRSDLGDILFLKVVFIAFVIAVLLLSAAATYSSWIASNNHKNSCSSRKFIVDAVKNSDIDFLTPPKGVTYTANQVLQIQELEAKAFSDLDKALC